MPRLSPLLLATLLVLPSFAPWLAPVASAAEVTGTDNLSATVNVALPITDVQITGATGTIPVKLLVTHGTLAMSTTTGLTFTGDQTGAELYFSGTVANVNAALATLTYTRASAGTDELEVSLVEPGEVFFSGNDHLYEYISVPAGLTWTEAQTAAAALERYGSTGYLVTITSAEENSFVADRLEGAGWMGASDSAVEGTWRWVTGPETGTALTYENWNDGEPNDSGGNEDCGQYLSGSSGEWNDLPCTGHDLTGYVVEFGAPGDLPDTAGTEFTITTYTAPVLNSVVPADNATRISPTTDLTLTFDRNVSVGTGYISVYFANGTLITRANVATQVTGSDTDTLTVNLPGALPNGASVYVNVDGTAINGASGGDYAGISNGTTWNFSVQPAASLPVAVPPSASLSLTDAMTTCPGGNVTLRGILLAEHASEYMVSLDPMFINSSWSTLSGDETPVSVTAPARAGERITVYAMVRGEAAAALTVSASLVAEPCPDPIVEDDDVQEEQVELWDSPWDNSLEPVTDVAGMQLIRGASYDTVYMLENGVRRPFMTEAIYFTWFTDFSAVQEVTNATLQVIPLGTPMLPKHSSLVKIQSRPEVYVVEDRDGNSWLRELRSEENALQEFGADWAQRVIDLDVTLFARFRS